MLILQHLLSNIHKGIHLLELLNFLVIPSLVYFLHFRAETSKASKEHQQVIVQLFFSIRMNDDRTYIICTIFIELNPVHATKRCSNLILPAASLVTKNTLQVDGLVRKLLLVSVLAFKGIECIQHTYSKG